MVWVTNHNDFLNRQEEFCTDARIMKSNNVNWSEQAVMDGDEHRAERDGRGKETRIQGEGRLPAASLIDKVISKAACRGGSGQASHKADKEQ